MRHLAEGLALLLASSGVVHAKEPAWKTGVFLHCYLGAGRSHLMTEAEEREASEPMTCEVAARNLAKLGRRVDDEVWATLYLAGASGMPRTPVSEKRLVLTEPEAEGPPYGASEDIVIPADTWVPYVRRHPRARPQLRVTAKVWARPKGKAPGRLLGAKSLSFDDRVQWE